MKKSLNYEKYSYFLVNKYFMLVPIVVNFEYNKVPRDKSLHLAKLVKAIQNWGRSNQDHVRDISVSYKDKKSFIRHPVFKQCEMSISETEEIFDLRLKRLVKENRSPAQLDFLKYRETYLKEKYPFY